MIASIIFFVGILLIALEDILKVNKTAVSVTMCVALWLLLLTNLMIVFASGTPELVSAYLKAYPDEMAALSPLQIASGYLKITLVSSLGDVAATLFFILASMAIVEVLDAHGSFSVISRAVRTRNKRSLVWVITFVTFFLAALLGNLATVIILVAILRKLIPDAGDRLPFDGLIIIAANAGGSWSPIGDVTTLLLWTGGNVSALHQVSHVILPAITMAAVSALLMSLSYKKGEKFSALSVTDANQYSSIDTPRFQTLLLVIGMCSLLMVPVLQSVINLPPYMSVLLGLSVLWIITDLRAAFSKDPNAEKEKVSRLFSHLDIATVLFFLGILMSVEALKQFGVLTNLASALNAHIPEPRAIAVLLGVCSSVLDNVALVAATMGMYPLETSGAFAADSNFWTLLAYCAVTGGSILIIGSASGVTVMGLEKVKFGYYLKKFTPLALLGYAAGVVVYLLV